MAVRDAISSSSPLLLLGCGKMGGALLEGWLADGLSADALYTVDPSGAPTGAKADHHAPSLTDLNCPMPRVVVVATKPQILADVLPALKPFVGEGTVVLSIAAGATVQSFRDVVGQDVAVIRAMPNTPAAIGKGMTVMVGDDLLAHDMQLAEALMASSGLVRWVEDEALMDAVTGVSGSGPAYVFHMVEAMAKAGVAQGLDADLAMTLARQTIIGAAALLDQSDESAATLRENVTSPNGTTAAGLSVLMADDGLIDLMTRTIAAATKRGKELGEG